MNEAQQCDGQVPSGIGSGKLYYSSQLICCCCQPLWDSVEGKTGLKMRRKKAHFGQMDHDLDHLVPHLPLRGCAGSASFRSNPGNMCYIQ